jgi:hypothetical protein
MVHQSAHNGAREHEIAQLIMRKGPFQRGEAYSLGTVTLNVMMIGT